MYSFLISVLTTISMFLTNVQLKARFNATIEKVPEKWVQFPRGRNRDEVDTEARSVCVGRKEELASDPISTLHC